MKRGLVGAALVAAFLAAPFAHAQGAEEAEMQALRAAVKSDKKAYVASLLNLTPAEAKQFWPAYDAYQRTIDLANRERSIAMADLIGRDKPVSDLYAKSVAKELITADEIEVKARRTLQNRIMKALPAVKAAKYLQLESKIRAAQAYDVAVGIPLIK